MKVIYGSRQSGKITKMIKEASESNSRIICADLKHCEYIQKVADNLKINILQPITIKQLKIIGCKRRNK